MISTTDTRYFAALGAVLLVALGVAGLLNAREPSAPAKIHAQHVLTQPLAGEPDKEIAIQIYTFPPQSAVPWHIHKGAVEIGYALQGTIMLEEEGKPPLAIEAGQTNIMAPDVVHRGWNPSETDPAKLYVVRVKPKDVPLATIVEGMKSTSSPPRPSAYPEDTKAAEGAPTGAP